jgi:hypothetical protein
MAVVEVDDSDFRLIFMHEVSFKIKPIPLIVPV